MRLHMMAPLSGTNARPVNTISPRGRVRTRPIGDSDIDVVARLLEQGFHRSTRQDWLNIFDRLAKHPAPEGLPSYGYLMESEGEPVGVILLVSSRISAGDVRPTRCNLSSWYVLPAFRSYGHLFISRILRKDDVTYINVSPAPHTLPLLQVQGFSRYSKGQFFAITAPFVSPEDRRAKVVPIDDHVSAPRGTNEHELLLAHAEYGCTSLWCVSDNHAYPFVFRRRAVKGLIPCAQLIYCRDIREFIQFSGPIGRFLARRGMPLVMMDSNGRVPGLAGIYVDGLLPKYYKGPFRPRLGDLAYTETALFGI
jgi:hypothetical protein